MIKRILKRFFSMIISIIIVISLVPAVELPALAATSGTLTVGVNDLEAKYNGTGDNSWTFANGIVTGSVISVKGTCSTDHYNTTLTFTNKKSGKATLKFKYTVSINGGTIQVDGSPVNANGSFEKELDAEGTVNIYLNSNSTSNATQIQITEISLVTSGSGTISTTFQPAGNGSYSVNGTQITSATTLQQVPSSPYALKAVPATGYKFMGWKNVTRETYISSALEYSYYNDINGVTVTPVFVPKTEPIFQVGGEYFTELTQANQYATENQESIISLVSDGTLTGSHTISAGNTLVIPYNNANTVVTTNPAVVTSYSTTTAPSAFRTLTMANGAKLILNGSLSVGGTLVASQTQGYNGLPTGQLGYIKMENGSSIEANSGSFMYVIGYIYGKGSVNVNDGATVYECFQIRDFRGGSATSSMKGAKKAFPLSQYYVQNIEVPMTLNQGAIVKAISAFNVNNAFQIPEIPFIGNNSNYMFQITNGSIVKDYVEETDRLNIKVNGSLALTSFTFEIPGSLGMGDINTNDFVLPINHNITVEIGEEMMAKTSLTIGQSLALLPGAEILVHENATCTISSGKRVIVYDSADWGNYCGEQHHTTGDDVPVKPLLFVAGGAPKVDRFTKTASSLADASVMINGTVDASAGAVYTTSGKANIYSTGAGQLKVGNKGTATKDYQATQSGSSISNVEIPIIPAVLKNPDREITPENNTFVYTDGYWRCKEKHSYGAGVVTTAPTCTEVGVKTFTCSVCGHSYAESVSATGHTAGAAATCTTPQICTVCDEVLNAATDEHGGDSCICAVKIEETYYVTLEAALKSVAAGQAITVVQDSAATEIFVKSANEGWFLRCGEAGSYTYENFDLLMTYWYVETYFDVETAWIGFGASFKGNQNAFSAVDDFGFLVNETEVWASKYGEAKPAYEATITVNDTRPSCAVTTTKNENTVRALIKVDEVICQSNAVTFKVSDKLEAYPDNLEGADVAARLAEIWKNKVERKEEL